MKQGFDHEKYLREQSEFILERVNSCEKLYLEFGGKLMEDMHAKRVLPGYDPNAKLKLLEKMKDQVEVVICVYAGDIERNKVRADFNITYDMEVFRLIDDLRSYQLDINLSLIHISETSQGLATTFAPADSQASMVSRETGRSSSSWEMLLMIRSNPSFASRLQMAAPIPREPPVTSARGRLFSCSILKTLVSSG